MKSKTRGATGVEIIVLVGALAALVMMFKPKVLDGDTRRANTSAQTTENLETATQKQGAEAAASVVKIGEANTEAPPSPSRNYIAQEVPVALAKLPAPDAQALLAAEKRKVAVMEGRLDEAAKLYASAMQRADTLQREREEALAARRAADDELQRVAALRLGAERQRNQIIVVAVVAGLLWLYTKFTRLSPGALAEAVTDIRSGTPPITALDGVATRLEQRVVRLFSKLKG